MTEEQERYLVIGEALYKFVKSMGWTSEQLALLYKVFCELGLQHDLTEPPNPYETAEPDTAPPKTEETAPEPKTDIAALKKEAGVMADELKKKNGKAFRSLLKQYGGRIDAIPVDNLAAFIAAVKEALK